MSTEYRRYRATGHKLKHSRSGVQDAYARGDCECGWTYTGWTHYRADVVRSHNQHVSGVLADKGWRVFKVNRAWEIFAANPKGAALAHHAARRIAGLFAHRDAPKLDGENTWVIDGQRYVVTIEE